MKNYYDILDVDEKADKDAIKKSYRKMASKYHPDKNGGSEAKFKEINEAYETLSDVNKKASYDNERLMRSGKSGSIFGDMGNININVGSGFGGSFGGGMKDIFDNIFRSSHGHHHHTNQKTKRILHITLEEAYSGSVRHLDNTKSVNIPAGVQNRTKFYVDEEIIEVHIVPHKTFKRKDNDLYTSIKVDVFDAMIGGKVELQHLDKSKIIVTIPSGIQHGQVLNLSSKGMIDIHSSHKKGSLFVQCNIVIPKNLTESEKQSIIDLREKRSKSKDKEK